MPTSYLAIACQYGNEPDFAEDVICDCGHVEDPKDVIEMEDGFIACGPCGKSLQGFEKAFGEEAELCW